MVLGYHLRLLSYLFFFSFWVHLKEKCLRLDRLFRDLKHYVCLYPVSYIVTPTAKTRPQKLHLWRDRFHRISWNRKIHVNPLPEAIISFCACFDNVVRPRQDILEQKSTVTAQNRCPKIRIDKRCCKASILATGQRLSFIIIVLQTLALSYQSRPTPSEPLFISISISLLSDFIFW